MGDGFIGMLSGIFSKKRKVLITSVNISWKGTSHQLGGIAVKGNSASIDIPFSNHTPENGADLPQMPMERVTGIDVDPPFVLHSVTPAPPTSIGQERIIFRLEVGVPGYSFSGPLNVHFASAKSVSIEINRMTLRPFGKAPETMDDRRIIREERGKEFEFAVRIPAWIDGKQVGSVRISPPFDQKEGGRVPFSMEGSEMRLTLKAPEFNYSGPMEIELDGKKEPEEAGKEKGEKLPP